MVVLNYEGTIRAFDRTNKREIRKKYVSGTRKTNLPTGDEFAQVTATRGFKHWFSTREAGMTVESTMTVNATCGQSEKEILSMGEEVSQLAEKMALGGMEEMDMHIDQFMKDTGHEKG